MVVDPRANPSASVTEVDFRSGQTVRQGEDSGDGGTGRELQISPRYDDFAWQAAALEPPAKERNKWLQGGLTLFAVAGFGAVLWFTYQWGLERGYREEVPIVRADSEPIKIRPEDPGGLVVPNQDKLVLNQVASSGDEPGVERLLSAPEAPQPLPKPQTSAILSETEAADPNVKATDQDVPEVPAEPMPAKPAVTAAETEPKSKPATAAEAPSEPAAVATKAADPAVPADVAPSAGGVAASSSAGATGTGTSTSGTAAVSPVQLAAIKQGDYVVQLASVTSADAAKMEWARLQKTFPALLGDMNLSVQAATVNGTEYHRIQTGPFPTRATAVDLCAQITAKSQACIVQQR